MRLLLCLTFYPYTLIYLLSFYILSISFSSIFSRLTKFMISSFITVFHALIIPIIFSFFTMLVVYLPKFETLKFINRLRLSARSSIHYI
jgi:ABC-type transport system involved in multi-copper enzyme maturation permease subunit